MVTYKIVPRTTPSVKGVHSVVVYKGRMYVNEGRMQIDASFEDGGLSPNDIMRKHMPDYPYIVVAISTFGVRMTGIDADTTIVDGTPASGPELVRIVSQDVRHHTHFGKREWDEFKVTLQRW